MKSHLVSVVCSRTAVKEQEVVIEQVGRQVRGGTVGGAGER